MPSLNINTKEIDQFAKKLKNQGKYDLPVVARQTLNSAAVAAKKKTLPRLFKQEFNTRRRTFIKANSKFDLTKGNDLNKMASVVGVKSKGSGKGVQQALTDLKFQERGGRIKGRSLVPIDNARTGKANARNVKKKFTMDQIKGKALFASRNKGKNKKERFVRTAIHAQRGGFVISEPNAAGKKFLYQINSVKKSKRNNHTYIKQTPLYSVEKGRSVRVKGRFFLQKTAKQRGKQLKKDFIKFAKKRLK